MQHFLFYLLKRVGLKPHFLVKAHRSDAKEVVKYKSKQKLGHE